jgi:hypothetical protein
VKPQDPAHSDFRKAVARFGNPYRFIDLEDGDADAQSPTVEQHRAYLRRLENPYALHGIVAPRSESEKPAFSNSNAGDGAILKKKLRICLSDVLNIYKPYAARSEWRKVADYEVEFLAEAEGQEGRHAQLIDKLERLKFKLMPGEKVEFNRAPAERIIGELKKLLH